MANIRTEGLVKRFGKFVAVDHVDVNLVFDPPWGMERMSNATRLELGLL